MKAYIDYIKKAFGWKTLMLIGVIVLFLTIGWYAFEYEGDSETIKYAVIIVLIVGFAFILGSYFSFIKAKKRNEQEEQ